MRAYRTSLVAVLALVAGFALALAIYGCPSRKNNVVMLPQTIKAGDTLTWKGIDPTIGNLTLTIPDGLCEPSADLGTVNGKYHVYVIKVGPQGGGCTVKTQSGNSTTPIPWYYKYQFEPAQGAGSTSPSPKLVQPPIELLNIVGSCDGCAGTIVEGPGARRSAAAYVQEEVELVEDPAGTFTPTVVDGDGDLVPNIIVPYTKSSVYWQLQGPGALTFTFVSTSPCSNSNGLKLSGSTCNLIDPATGKHAAPGAYTYYVSVDNYSSQYLYTLTVQAPPLPPK
jgi:hypothetical protein